MIKASSKPLISIKNLSISFLKKNEVVNVVNNISFNLLKDEVLGIVGESGSGKSVTALSILKLLPKNKTISKGEVIFNNTNLLELQEATIRQVRGKDISIIFQEPMSVLNPTMKCVDQLRECFDIEKIDKKDIENEISLLIKKVKLGKVDNFNSKYPHQLSGGQKQRLMIAMAIACKPKLLIADEPTTALDVTVQKEIIELLLKIKRTEGLSIIFISHDLALVSEIADRLIVMFKGKIIEKGKAAKIFSNPIENLDQHVDFCAMTPFQVANSMKHSKDNFKWIKKLIIGGASIDYSLEKELKNLKTECFHTFGMTETVSHIAIRKINSSFTLNKYSCLDHVTVAKNENDQLIINAPEINVNSLVTNDIINLVNNKTFIWKGRKDCSSQLAPHNGANS